MENDELYRRLNTALKLGDTELALKFCGELTERMPDNPNIAIIMGNIHLKNNNIKAALHEYKRAGEIFPNNPEVYNNLGLLYKKVKKYPQAIHSFKKALSFDENRADIYYNLANLYKDHHEYKEAVKYYRTALRLNPDHSMTYNNLGTLYEKENRISDARSIYMDGLRKDKYNPVLRYNLGRMYAHQGEHGLAIVEFEKVLERRPTWTDAMNNLGLSLQESGRLDEAEKIFEKIHRLEPSNEKVVNNLAYLSFHRQDYERAENLFTEILETNPDYKKAKLNLGRLYIATGKSDKALSHLKPLFASSSDDPEMKTVYVQALIDSGNLAEAEAELRQLPGDYENGAAVQRLWGDLYLKQKKYGDAVDMFDQAHKIDPHTPEILLQIAEAYELQGNRDLAVTALETLIGMRSDCAAARKHLAEIFYKTNRPDSALEQLGEILSRNPDDEEVLNRIVSIKKEHGGREEVRDFLERVISKSGTEDSSAETLDSMLNLYEKVADEYGEEHKDEWQENFRLLVQDMEREDPDEAEEDNVYFNDIRDYDGEIVPIIDVGGIEPVIAVNEDPQTMYLEEMEEELEEYPVLEEEENLAMKVEGSLGQAGDGRGGFGPGAPPPGMGMYYFPQGFPYPPAVPVPGQVPAGPVVQTGPVTVDVPQVNVEMPEVPKTSEKEKPEPGQEKPDPEPEKSDQPADTAPKTENGEDIFSYLEKLTKFLPMKDRLEFERSDIKDKMHSIRDRLNRLGIPSLDTAAEDKILPGKVSVTPEQISNTFSFMRNLTEYVPDQPLSLEMQTKIDNILTKIKRGRNGI